MQDVILRCLEAKDISLFGNVVFPWTSSEKTVKKWDGYLEKHHFPKIREKQVKINPPRGSALQDDPSLPL